MIRFQLLEPPFPGEVEENLMSAEGYEFIISKKALLFGIKKPGEGETHSLVAV